MTTPPEDAPAAPIYAPEPEPTALPLFLALVLFSAAGFAIWSGLQPPEPRPAGEGEAAFSAERARELHAELLGDEPRPIGSPQNAEVRERLQEHLTELGYLPQVQKALVTTPGGAAIVYNVIASLEGRDPEAGVVLLMAHYDSVGAGPGASDDGAGVVALLEIARILKAEEPLERPVIFLLTDGEEVALLGAQAFARLPWAARVETVVNLEARGSSGPARLFETGPNELGLIRRFANVVERPVTSSISSFVYERMPNDTDFTVFRRMGRHGYNFAFIGGVDAYHGPGDTLEAQDPGSLQHLGDQALAVVRASAQAAEPPETGGAVYFDLAGRALVFWDTARNPWMLGGAAALLLLTIVALLFRQAASAGGIAAGAIAVLLIAVAGFLVGHALEWAFRFAGSPKRPDTAILPGSPWVPWCVGAALTVLLTLALGRRISAWSLWAGTWMIWLVTGAALVYWAPSAAYPFLVPAGVAAFIGLFGFGWVAPRSSLLLALAISLPAGVAALTWMPLLDGVVQSLGSSLMWGSTLLASLLTASLIPAIAAAGLIGRVFIGGAALVAAATAVTLAFLSPECSEQNPPRIGLGYVLDADKERARWLVILTDGELPEDVRRAGPFAGDGARPFPWSPSSQRAWETHADSLDLPAPELEILETGVEAERLRVRARLRSPRGASVAELYFPPDSPVQLVRILDAAGLSGDPVTPTLIPGQPWQRFRFDALPEEGAELELGFAAEEPAAIWLLDRTLGLPEEGELLVERRNQTSEPGRWGDGTWVSRKVDVTPE